MNRLFKERFFKNLEIKTCAKPLLKPQCQKCKKSCDSCDFSDYNGVVSDTDILNLIGILTNYGIEDWIGGIDADSIADSVLLTCSSKIERFKKLGQNKQLEQFKSAIKGVLCKP